MAFPAFAKKGFSPDPGFTQSSAAVSNIPLPSKKFNGDNVIKNVVVSSQGLIMCICDIVEKYDNKHNPDNVHVSMLANLWPGIGLAKLLCLVIGLFLRDRRLKLDNISPSESSNSHNSDCRVNPVASPVISQTKA